jgi:Tfp pilus assembly protein PilO
MTSTNRVIVAALAVVVLAIAFWMLLLGPKRDEASKLGAQVEEVTASLAQHQAEAAQALEARQDFAADYQHLVVLGKAVPGDDETASLLVQLNTVADKAGVSFRALTLEEPEGAAATAPAPAPEAPSAEGVAPEASAGTPASLASPTEVAASTLPLGAAIGPAGLGVMPYTLTFDGQFFQIADFIKGLDSLVKTQNARVSVDGRLITINGFSLAPAASGFPALGATFSVTTYLTPPAQGVTAGATPGAPAPATAAPAATTTGGTP